MISRLGPISPDYSIVELSERELIASLATIKCPALPVLSHNYRTLDYRVRANGESSHRDFGLLKQALQIPQSTGLRCVSEAKDTMQDR